MNKFGLLMFLGFITLYEAFITKNFPLRITFNSSPKINSRLTQYKVSVNNDVSVKTSPTLDANLIRSLNVIDVHGNEVVLGSRMGDKKSAVIFLRHLGCPFCWGYANKWCSYRETLQKNDIKGPFFISIGNVDKLELFLQSNPNIPRDSVFVDQPSYDAYNKMGIKSLFEDLEQTKQGGFKFKFPSLSSQQWIQYFTNVRQLAPSTDKIVEVGGRLGASYGINGKDIVYTYEDGVPGDHPDPLDIIQTIIKS